LSEKTDKIEVRIKYKDAESTFSSNNIEKTWLLLNKFFSGALPSFDIAAKLWLNVDLKKLASEVDGVIAFSKEGTNLLLPKNKLTDNETLILWLLAAYLGQGLGLLANDSLSKEELQAKLGKSGKITSTRLGELVKNDWVTKTADDRFKITTFGVVQVQKEILPKVKAKTT
jgi:hypothetical protein